MSEENRSKQTQQSKKRSARLAIFLAISAILHACLCFFFLSFGFQKRVLALWSALTETLTPAQQKQLEQDIFVKRQKKLENLKALQSLKKDKNDRLAKLVAQKSNFGWVLFDEPQQPKPKAQPMLEIPTTLDGDVGHAKVSLAGEEKPIAQKSTPMAPPIAKAMTDRPDEEMLSTQSLKQEAQQEERQPEKGLSEACVKERIEQIKATQEKLIDFKEDDRLSSTRVRGATDHSGNPKRNIIALTKGFVEKLRGEDGTDLIDRDGDPTKRPTIEELKYLMYESKINWCLQAAWKQNFYHRPMQKPLEGDVTVAFSIDQHGKITSSQLLQSSGHKELDDMVIKSIHFASPFPPLPKHFQTSTYSTGRIIKVYTDRLKF